jgi:UDP-glucose 4-epimerase
MRVLVTGGCGYIGSHVALALVDAGHDPILLDNFSNSCPQVADRLSAIAGRPIVTIRCDVRDNERLRLAMSTNVVTAVIHCAARKAVAESVACPLLYHSSNVGGMLSLLDAMDAVRVRSIVFSSSATVYGQPQWLPLDEDHPTRATNPYGQTKLICENMLSDLARSASTWRVSLLRYFNPIGAHRSGLIGDDPEGLPNNIMPLITRVANGKLPRLEVYGTDFPTEDGTAVRDYVHVLDLADGHVAALEALHTGAPLQIYNLGTGRGTSVKQLVAAFERATGVEVPWVAAERRAGDEPAFYAAVTRARRGLGWSATRSLEQMCVDSWRFAASPQRRPFMIGRERSVALRPAANASAMS